MVEKFPGWLGDHQHVAETAFPVKILLGLELAVVEHFLLVVLVILIAIVDQPVFEDAGSPIDFEGLVNEFPV